MTFTRKCQGVVERTRTRQGVQVCPCTEGATGAGDDNGIGVRGVFRDDVKRITESFQTEWPESGRPTVVTVGDREHGDAAPTATRHRRDDDVDGEVLYGVIDHAPKWGFSQTIVPPWPRPTHIVVIP